MFLPGSLAIKMAGSVFTHSLLSATNFLVGLYLIRTAAKEEYGLYIMCFSVLQIFSSIQNALVNTPMMVLLPAKKADQQTPFLAGLAGGQYLSLSPVLALCGVGLLLTSRSIPLAPEQCNALLALLFAIPASYAREFLRALQYVALNIRAVIYSDLAFIGGLAVTLLLSGSAGGATAAKVILALGAAGLASAGYAYRREGRKFSFRFAWMRGAFRETWFFSRWALMGVAVANVQSFAYIFIISTVMGLSQTAEISAARLFFMPFGILLSSSQRILLAKGAHMLKEGLRDFLIMILRFLGMLTLLWAIYFLVVWFSCKWVIVNIFTDKYADIGPAILGWGMFFGVSTWTFILNHALQALKDFKMLSLLGAVSAAVTLGGCLILTHLFGLWGGLLSLIMGEMVAVGAYGWRFTHLMSPRPAERRVKEAALG